MSDLYFYFFLLFFGIYFLFQSKSGKAFQKYKKKYNEEHAIKVIQRCNFWGWLFIFFSIFAMVITFLLKKLGVR